MSYMELNTHLHSINSISITKATFETLSCCSCFSIQSFIHQCINLHGISNGVSFFFLGKKKKKRVWQLNKVIPWSLKILPWWVYHLCNSFRVFGLCGLGGGGGVEGSRIELIENMLILSKIYSTLPSSSLIQMNQRK